MEEIYKSISTTATTYTVHIDGEYIINELEKRTGKELPSVFKECLKTVRQWKGETAHE